MKYLHQYYIINNDTMTQTTMTTEQKIENLTAKIALWKANPCLQPYSGAAAWLALELKELKKRTASN